MSWFISKADIPYISLGAGFLSSGGGGDAKTFEYMLLSMMKEDDYIEAKSVHELTRELVLPTGIVGSPLLLSEQIPSVLEMTYTLDSYQQISGHTVDSVMPIEIGGMNALYPLVIAFIIKKPVVDGDGMGRAFPDLFMSTLAVNDSALFPLILSSGAKELIIHHHHEYQQLFHPFIFQNRGYAHLVCSGIQGKQLSATIIPGTLKLARQIGHALSNGSLKEKINALKETLDQSIYGEVITPFYGRISEVKRWFDNKRLVGTCLLTGLQQSSGQQAEVQFHNEFLMLSVSGGQIFTVPDLIIFINHDNGLPISVKEIRQGMGVMILIVKAPGILKSERMRTVTSPEAFGLIGSIPQKGGEYDENWH